MNTGRRRTLALLLGIMLAVCAVLTAFRNRPLPEPPARRDLTRSELTLRDDRLCAAGQHQPFTGRLVEDFSPHHRKLEIEIQRGKANGLSRGWHENGEIEVEEHFVEGVSHGQRTRWHENGNKKSTAQIVHGELEGPYVEWHENGVKAVEMTLRAGHPDGVVQAWHPTGERKSETTFAGGKIASREFWPAPGTEASATARAANP